MEPTPADRYDELLQRIGATLETGRARAIQAVHAHNLETYWRVGRQIVEFEQGGKARAEYGAGLIPRLAKDLALRHGRGFSLSNVKAMRKFYLAYPKGQTPSGLLSWSHVVELLKIDDPLERGFYEKQMALERWGVREARSHANHGRPHSTPGTRRSRARKTRPSGSSESRRTGGRSGIPCPIWPLNRLALTRPDLRAGRDDFLPESVVSPQ